MKNDFPRIKNHTIIRQIGSGGYGNVFLAKRGDGALVALKIIATANAKREADAVKKYGALTDKDNIVKILEHGEIDGAIYYTMPLADTIDGCEFPPNDWRWREKSLAKIIDDRLEKPGGGWFSRAEIIGFMAPIFKAAIAIGENGMLHRDIKPDNILFFGGKPKLSDLGLLQDDRPTISNIGTPMYIAPSWYINKGGNPDAFGLAATFYTLITGNLPDTIGRAAYRFPEKTASAMTENDRQQWLHWHRCILRAIAENPAERFTRLEDFLRAIESEDFSSSIYLPADKPKRSKGGAAKKRLAAAAFLAAAAAAAFFGTRAAFDGQGAERPRAPRQAQAETLDEALFKKIYKSGFRDREFEFYISSHAEWVADKKNLYEHAKKGYEDAKKTARLTSDDVRAKIIKKYEDEFFRKFGGAEKAENPAQDGVETAKNKYIAAQKKWIDAETELELARAKAAPAKMHSDIETMAIMREHIENPSVYRIYVNEAYHRYKQQKDFEKSLK